MDASVGRSKTSLNRVGQSGHAFQSPQSDQVIQRIHPDRIDWVYWTSLSAAGQSTPSIQSIRSDRFERLSGIDRIDGTSPSRAGQPIPSIQWVQSFLFRGWVADPRRIQHFPSGAGAAKGGRKHLSPRLCHSMSFVLGVREGEHQSLSCDVIDVGHQSTSKLSSPASPSTQQTTSNHNPCF